jgi:hypothetical protein
MALRTSLILSRPRSGRVEGRMALIQPPVNWITASQGRCLWLALIPAQRRDGKGEQ